MGIFMTNAIFFGYVVRSRQAPLVIFDSGDGSVHRIGGEYYAITLPGTYLQLGHQFQSRVMNASFTDEEDENGNCIPRSVSLKEIISELVPNYDLTSPSASAIESIRIPTEPSTLENLTPNAPGRYLVESISSTYGPGYSCSFSIVE